MEPMGFTTFGYGGGRVDIDEPEEDIYWGLEDEWLGTEDARYETGENGLGRFLENPHALKSAYDIRDTFEQWR